MSEYPQKKMNFTETLHDDLVEHIMTSFLPIKTALQSRLVSKRFRHTQVQSRDIDFSSVRGNQLKVVRIIGEVFDQHKGLEINRLVLNLNHKGVEDKIITWITACLNKNIQELELDFSKSKKIMEIPVDFSAIQTLTILKLRWCKFEIPNNSPKGLKLLRTLALMKTKVKKEMIDAMFGNCIHLEMLELINCQLYGVLSINAQHNKKFKSLVMYSNPKLQKIVLNSPTLECFKYDGYVRMVDFSRVNALKEVKLHYIHCHHRNFYNPYDMAIDNMEAYTEVHVLATTNIFLEAFTNRRGAMRQPTLWFLNLQEFQICFKAPNDCTLIHIAEFLKQCPNLKQVLIDINDFTFTPFLFLESHQKPKIYDGSYLMNTIKNVKIMGYKNHWHELNLLEFFVRNAEALEELKLIEPRDPNATMFQPDHERITSIRRMSPKEDLIKFVSE